MIAVWWRGLVRRRTPRLLAAAAGVAVAVALLACLGQFLAGAQATMTARAARSVVVDWQVQVEPGADPSAVLDAVHTAAGTTASELVSFGTADGLAATADATTRTTGAARVLGLPDGYRRTFPGQLRTLAGADTGTLLAQQTAANLAALPGDTITLTLGGTATSLRVDGVVDLPAADSLFQTVGAPPGAQPSAPPDNVVLLPASRFSQLFTSGTGRVTTQVHAARAHLLPPDPATAYQQVTGAARNLEATTAGAAKVGDNLGAALDAARSDAAYARILFLFLGLPGAVLAGFLTAAVTGAGAQRRRREQALLRLRGATGGQILVLTAVEALTVAVLGAVVGVGAAALIGTLAFGSPHFGSGPASSLSWTTVAVVAGLLIAAVTVLGPARRDLRVATVAVARRPTATDSRARAPWWARCGLDVVLLAASAAVFWATGLTDYTLVLAPEGVAQIAVSYWAFAGPALLWLGFGLLAWRIAELLLRRRLVGPLLRPVAGTLAPTVAASLARRRHPVARSVVLLALALCFAVSTATFNATYQQQAEADAALTNGADVTVTLPPGPSISPDIAQRLAAVPGVRGAEPLQHRFAYVGADLQDLYGVRPDTIAHATVLQDAYFEGGTANQLLGTLTARPDSILVSAETVKDYQLLPGDLLRLRLPDARSGQPVTVPFHYVGIIKEFPTAPKDSFFVANAAYVAQTTGSDAVGAFLLDTGGRDTTAVTARVHELLGPVATVTDIADVRARIGSSLTAVDLAGLTRVELGFALVLAAAAGGLVLALGLVERRRSTAITRILGATPRQVRAFLVGESLTVGVGGILLGALAGAALAWMLVQVLTGVFDPPPSAPAVPWGYLALTLALTAAALLAATTGAGWLARRPPLDILGRP